MHGLHRRLSWRTLKYYVTPRSSPRRLSLRFLAIASILTLPLALSACAETEPAPGSARLEEMSTEDAAAKLAEAKTRSAEDPGLADRPLEEAESQVAAAEPRDPSEAPTMLEVAAQPPATTAAPSATTASSAAPGPAKGSAESPAKGPTEGPAIGPSTSPVTRPVTSPVAANPGPAARPDGVEDWGAGESADGTGQVAAAPSSPKPSTPPSSTRYRAGEDPDFAERMGWPVIGPEPLPGALLPHNRIIAYYGNPLSRRMGVLGEYDPEEMLARLDKAVAEWEEADPATPVIPALHLIAVVAQADSGTSGKYRLRMRDTLIERVAEWAETRDALVFLDVQVGMSTLEEELPRLLPFLRRPNFHLGIDPEFSMKDGSPPGKRIGTFDAADINYASALLAGWVREYDLPPKILVVHRFTRRMVTNSTEIELRPEVQVVMHMDGWGAAWLKRDSYRDYVVREPVQFPGFKIFYHHDVREAGWKLMSPADMLRLRPVPVYIQYQ